MKNVKIDFTTEFSDQFHSSAEYREFTKLARSKHLAPGCASYKLGERLFIRTFTSQWRREKGIPSRMYEVIFSEYSTFKFKRLNLKEIADVLKESCSDWTDEMLNSTISEYV